MADAIKVKGCVVEKLATDNKVGYSIQVRILHSNIETDARILSLQKEGMPFDMLLTPAEDLFGINPAVDYSDVDTIFGDEDDDDEECDLRSGYGSLQDMVGIVGTETPQSEPD